jgi:hypothetical protein
MRGPQGLTRPGTPTTARCPACGSRVVYNGNYFCEHFGDGCDWALPSIEEGEGTFEEAQVYLEGYRSCMRFRGKRPDPKVVRRLLGDVAKR